MFMLRRSLRCLVLAGAVLPAVEGCGGQVKPVPVAGVVTLDGQPLRGVTVTFLPRGPGGLPAHGWSRADGTFRLSTFRPDDGALPGEYTVVVHYTAPPDIPGVDGDQQKAMAAIQKARPARNKSAAAAIPAGYGDQTRTPLRQKVPPEGKVTLALRSTGP